MKQYQAEIQNLQGIDYLTMPFVKLAAHPNFDLKVFEFFAKIGSDSYGLSGIAEMVKKYADLPYYDQQEVKELVDRLTKEKASR